MMRKLRVRDWMHLGVVTCSADTPAWEIAETMRANDVSSVVVADLFGYVIGVISRTDLMNATFGGAYLPQWRGLAARPLMTSPVVRVRADAAVVEAVRLLRDRHVHRAVVTVAEGQRERPIGILSVTDLVGHLGEV
jgi:CBS domain-containing protein